MFLSLLKFGSHRLAPDYSRGYEDQELGLTLHLSFVSKQKAETRNVTQKRHLLDSLDRALPEEPSDYHGLSIMIAIAPGEGIADEISPLAQKLADVFDVSGLFLLVSLNGNVQLVARSTSE